MELKRVPLNSGTLELITQELEFWGETLDHELVIIKGEAYGDSWQAEGPFVASGRMKDKISRVETFLTSHGLKAVRQTTTIEGFQDILEMMAYGKMLMLYWAFNDLGIQANAPEPVRELYRSLREGLEELGGPDAAGG